MRLFGSHLEPPTAVVYRTADKAPLLDFGDAPYVASSVSWL